MYPTPMVREIYCEIDFNTSTAEHGHMNILGIVKPIHVAITSCHCLLIFVM